ncbi:MAG: DNA polymerase III subunit beta [Candidatus Nanopelagicales bacterium]|nr:DNA polymerase III subunit beta [Actinomycetota bacterium]MBT5807356.1 DNA polymerase III subunit beta [Actinomycetota bacterium]NCG02123.1 DNA polymerase III subunit beta [Actinomycetales bacterium]
MHIRVERDALAQAVTWAARTLPSRPSMPVLSGVMLIADQDSLTLSSFDYEVSARVQLNVDVIEIGKVLVSGRLLADITKALPAAPVVLKLEGNRVLIECGRSSFTLPTLPVEDYPALPDMPTTAGSVDGDVFSEAVAQVAIAAGKDDTIPVLTGIRVEIDGSHVTLAATDRYRLAVRTFPWSPTKTSIELNTLVPARILADAAKSMGSAQAVELAIAPDGEKLIGFEAEGMRTTTRLLDGEFPKYRSLLPNESSTTAIVDTTELVNAVKRVALVAERNTPIRMHFAHGEINMRAGSGDDAQANEVLEVDVDGDPIEIAFNPGYLLDGLHAIDAPKARFSFTLATKPVVITGMTNNNNDTEADYRYLLMPVRLTG